MPKRIPGNNMLNSTSRTEDAMLRLQRLKTEGDIVLHGKLKKCNVPSPLPVKADIHADKTLSPKATVSKTDLTANGERSGARAPEPKSSAEFPPSPQVKTPVKPVTPNLDWPTPKPGSADARVKSASPRMETPKPLPPIASPKPFSPAGQPPKSPAQQNLKWPSPKPAEPQPS